MEDLKLHYKATGVFYVKVSTDIISSKEPTIGELRAILKSSINNPKIDFSVGEAEMFTLINKMR